MTSSAVPDLRQLAAAIEGSPAEDLLRTVLRFYGDGLERLLTVLYDAAGERGDDLLAALVADPQVEALLSLHGLHPVAVEERVDLALESVRPYLASHAGDIELLGVHGGVATVRLHGTCSSCPSSEATMKLAVERAILERVPEIHAVRT